MSPLGMESTSEHKKERVSTNDDRIRGGEGILHILAPLAIICDPRVVVVDAEYLVHSNNLWGERG